MIKFLESGVRRSNFSRSKQEIESFFQSGDQIILPFFGRSKVEIIKKICRHNFDQEIEGF